MGMRMFCSNLIHLFCNLSLELHSADLANFGRSQTISLASRPKFAKNHESQTENPSVVLNAKSKNNPSLRESALADSWQSTKNGESNDSSLRGRIADSPKQSTKKIKSARSVNPNKSFCYFWLLPKVESSLPYQPKSTQKGNFANSTNPLSLNSLVFSRKRAAPPSPLPLRAKSCRFSLLGGEPRNSDSSKKSAGGTTAPLIPDFLHHESGEIRCASHNLILSVDCHESLRDSRNDGLFDSSIRPRNDKI